MKALILCAGRGERLKPLTDFIPKPLVPIKNKPALEYLIMLCKKNNIFDIAINTSYLPEKIKAYFGDGKRFGVRITYSDEPELLGTSGALNNFRKFFTETFLVLYGDNITDINLSEMLKYHREKKASATLFLHKQELVDDKTTQGIVMFDENNRITEIIEKPAERDFSKIDKIPSSKKLSNSGIYIIEKEILELIPSGFSDFAKDIFPKAISKNLPIFAYTQECYFKEIGQMPRYLKAKQEIESGEINLDIL